MKKKTKSGILVLVLLLAVGFATVSTSLVINGTIGFNTNEEDFKVIFTKSIIDGVDMSKSTISEDGQTLEFTTSELAILGDKSELNFEVTNNSTQYDAKIEMNCTANGENYSKYYTISNTIPEVVPASSNASGSVVVELTRTSVDEITETFTCTISATATERTEAAESNLSKITVTATDENNVNLNAKAYEITENEEEELLNSLVETGYIENTTDVDALIKVESDEFDDIAKTVFNVSPIASEGDTVVILHFNEETNEWEYISTETVDENGLVSADFKSYSPVAFIVIKEDGIVDKIKHDHSYAEKILTQGTCETASLIEYTCNICKQTYQEEKITVEHNYVDVLHVHTGDTTNGGGCYTKANIVYTTSTKKCGSALEATGDTIQQWDDVKEQYITRWVFKCPYHNYTAYNPNRTCEETVTTQVDSGKRTYSLNCGKTEETVEHQACSVCGTIKEN